MPHRVAAAYVEQARCQSGATHVGKDLFCPLDAHAPILRVAALRAHVKGHARKVGSKGCRFCDDALDLGGMRAKLAGKRPIAADVGRVDAKVHFRVRLDADDLAQFLDAVEHIPFHSHGSRIL